MSEFIVNPSSVSQSQIKQDVEAWLQSLPDADQWSLFYASSTGQTVIELISGMLAFLKYDSTTARREAYIQFALNRSSKIGAAQFLGYSAFRGRNAILDMTFTPSSTQIYEKYDIIGTVKDRDLILLDSYVANAGVPLSVQVAVGQLQSEELVAQNTNLNVFRFTQKNTSEDVRIFIDGVEVPYDTEVEGLLDFKFQLQSNVNGSVDAKYLNILNSQTPQYFTGSIIRLDSIILKDVDFTLSDVALDEAEGTLDAVSINSFFQDIETIDEIGVNAPLKNETKFVVRARNDQPKLFQALNQEIIDASAKDVSAAVMELFYLKEDGSRFTPAEKEQLVTDFDIYRPHGLLPPLISEPNEIRLVLNFEIFRDPNASGDIVGAVDEVMAGYENKLGQSINILDIEQQLESYNFIKVARVQYTSGLWEALRGYAEGRLVRTVTEPNLLFRNSEIIYRSGSSEPSWPITIGSQIDDGKLVWECFYKDDLSEIQPWVQDEVYRLGDVVKPTVGATEFAYRVVKYLRKSGSSEPVYPPLAGETPENFEGTTFVENNILWRARQLEGTPDTWQANTDYALGSEIVPTDPSGSDNVGIMWQAQSYVGVSGSTAPAWPSSVGSIVTDGDVIWEAVDATLKTNEIDDSEYYKFVKNVSIS
jgi:hypothetical protein